jgi:nucleoside-diphosphate-sugar epimerase
VDVLVTGGNGYVGRHLVAALVDRGDQVRVLALAGEDTAVIEEMGVTVHFGDVCDPESLPTAFDGIEGVVHLAAMMHVWRPMSDYRAVNVGGTAHAARAAQRAGVRRFVHMSSSSVYGIARRLPVDESFPLAPVWDPYPVTKAEGDRLVQRLVAEEGLPAVILRPDQIFGPGDHLHLGATAARLRRGRGIVVGRGDNAVPLVYVSDLVQGLLLALDHPAALGHTFNITNDAPLTQEEFLREIALAIGAPAPRVHVPYLALYAAASMAEHVPIGPLTWARPPITRLGVAFLGKDLRCSIDAARVQLGYEPLVPLRDGVHRSFASDAAPRPSRASAGTR